MCRSYVYSVILVYVYPTVFQSVNLLNKEMLHYGSNKPNGSIRMDILILDAM